MFLLNLYFEFFYKFLNKSLLLTGCYFNIINIIFLGLYVKNKNTILIKKVANFLINSLIVGSFNISLKLMSNLNIINNNIEYDIYKYDIYNIFLYLISRLYPLCLFNEIFINSNIINLMSFFFISLHFTRYNFKKQVVLALENNINSMNNRYRSFIT